MTWAALAYAAIGYYHFRLTLRHIEQWDSAGTVLLNAGLALTVGPLLLVPAMLVSWVTGNRDA